MPGVSDCAESRTGLAMAPVGVWPSALLNSVGTPVAIISQLNTRPTGAPVNASMAPSRATTHDSGSGWIATPFLYDSRIRNSTPVYPGALGKPLKQVQARTSASSSLASISPGL